MRSEYKIKPKITIKFANMSDDDFAITSGSTIHFNKKVLRNRKITEQNLKGNYLASAKSSGISAHEMGHIISQNYGEKGIEIAKRAYYNIYREKITDGQILKFLNNNISKYSIKIPYNKIGKTFKKEFYIEVIPEIFAKNTTNPDKFSREFVKLLKEEYKL